MAEEDADKPDETPDDKPDEKPDTTKDTTRSEEDGDESKLGDAGKRALDAMKREKNAAKKQVAELLAKVKAFEDKDKTEGQRLQEAAEEAKTRAAKAESSARKLQMALDRAPEGASLAHIKAVAKRISGDSDEELEADCDELFALFAPQKENTTTTTKKEPPGKPKERLSGGGDPDDEPEEMDPRKLAEAIGRH